MGQSRFYITWSFTRFMFGIRYTKKYMFEIHFLFLVFGIGLTSGAKGFDFWRE